MFPFALIDDAVQQVSDAAKIVQSVNEGEGFEDIKIPVLLNVPDRVLSNITQDADQNYIIRSDEYTFLQQLTDDNAVVDVYSTQSVAQRLPMGTVGNKLRKVTAVLSRPGSANGSTGVAIYTDNSGLPGSLIASSATINNSTITQNVKQSYTFTFSTEVALSPDTVYWLVMTNTASSTYKITWYCNLGDIDSTLTIAVNTGSWAADTTRNMAFTLVGYLTEGYFEVPVGLSKKAGYTGVYVNKTDLNGSSATVDLINLDSGATLYEGLTDGQVIGLDPQAVAQVKFKVVLKRDPSVTLEYPKVDSFGFKGNMYSSRYQWIDRLFYTTDMSAPTLSGNLLATAGGLRLNDTVLRLEGHAALGGGGGSYVSQAADFTLSQPVVNGDRDIAITSLSMYLYYGSSTAVDYTLRVWEDDNGNPGNILGEGVVSVNYTWATKTVEFANPIKIEAGEKYHIGIVTDIGGSTVRRYYTYNQTYNGFYAVLNGTDQTYCLEFQLNGRYISGTAAVDLYLPGVAEVGVFKPLLYQPEGSSVAISVYDGLDNTKIIDLDTDERCSLCLMSTQALSVLRFNITLRRSEAGLSPILGLCLNYDGSPMTPEVRRHARYMSYAANSYSTVGTLLEVSGQGFLKRLYVGGYMRDATVTYPGDKYRVTIDDTVIDLNEWNAGTSWTTFIRYLNWVLGWQDTEDTNVVASGIPFTKKLKIERTQANGYTNNANVKYGAIVYLEVNY